MVMRGVFSYRGRVWRKLLVLLLLGVYISTGIFALDLTPYVRSVEVESGVYSSSFSDGYKVKLVMVEDGYMNHLSRNTFYNAGWRFTDGHINGVYRDEFDSYTSTTYVNSYGALEDFGISDLEVVEFLDDLAEEFKEVLYSDYAWFMEFGLGDVLPDILVFSSLVNFLSDRYIYPELPSIGSVDRVSVISYYNNLRSVMLDGVAVCGGSATLVKELLWRFGIESWEVTGWVISSDSGDISSVTWVPHAWLRVRLVGVEDGRWHDFYYETSGFNRFRLDGLRPLLDETCYKYYLTVAPVGTEFFPGDLREFSKGVCFDFSYGVGGVYYVYGGIDYYPILHGLYCDEFIVGDCSWDDL